MNDHDEFRWELLIPNGEEEIDTVDSVMNAWRTDLRRFAPDERSRKIIARAKGTHLRIEAILDIENHGGDNQLSDEVFTVVAGIEMDFPANENDVLKRFTIQRIDIDRLFTVQLIKGLDAYLRERLAHVLVAELYESSIDDTPLYDDCVRHGLEDTEQEQAHATVYIEGYEKIAAFYEQLKTGNLVT